MNRLQNRRGQTSVEYLLLMAVVFITGYLMMTGPVATFTAGMIQNIRAVTGNIIRNAELDGESLTQGANNHPSDSRRLRALHL